MARAERDHHRKVEEKEQPVECCDNKNASALNQDRTQQVDPEKYCKPSGEDPSSKFLTAIVIAFVQFEVSHLK